MKPNTALFICLFFSAIISIKASISNNYGTFQELTDWNADDSTVGQQLSGTFQFIPSQSLLEMENDLTGIKAQFIEEDKVKETFVNMFMDRVHTKMAERSFKKTYDHWVQLTSGTEAPKVFGTFGENYKKFLTSKEGANTIHKLVTIAHKLLSKSADDMRGQDLINVLIETYNLFTKAEMPGIVDDSGNLIIEAVNNKRSYECTVQFFSTLQNLMNKPKFNEKLENYLKNEKATVPPKVSPSSKKKEEKKKGSKKETTETKK